MIFTIAMRNAGLLKINRLVHCLEDEVATVCQNIGKAAVNCWHVFKLMMRVVVPLFQLFLNCYFNPHTALMLMS